MKVQLAVGVALLAACSQSSGQSPSPSQDAARAGGVGSQATEAGDVAGGETSEFSGNIGACPEIASSEPLDLEDPEVASWVAMAQGHHEQTLGWKRLVLSDEVRGFEEHTSVSIDVNVLGGRDVMYGSAGNTDNELAGCEGLRARQIELEITLATADGAVATTFRSWFQPGASDTRGVVLNAYGLNPDSAGPLVVSGTLELGLDPALGGTPQFGVDIEFSADSVQGSLLPAVMPEPNVWPMSAWWPVEAMFPDDPCGKEGRSIGLDAYSDDIGATPRAYFKRMPTAWGRAPIPAVWRSLPSDVVPSPSDVESPLDLPPPTEIRLAAGEPTLACAMGGSITVYAPLTVTTADGRVNLTQSFAFNMYGASAYINERTPWVPAADFNEHIGLGGVNLESGYGSVYFQDDIDWQNGRIEGALEVSEWDAFTDQRAPYPVLEWCRGERCAP